MLHGFLRLIFFTSALFSAAFAPCLAQTQSPNNSIQATPLSSKTYPFLGNLSVDIEEPYPKGYGPIWSFPDAIKAIDVDFNANFGGNIFRRYETLQAGLFADPLTGRILFAWQGAVAQVCSAFLAGTEVPLKLSSTPKSFKLTEISVHNESRLCRQASRYVQNWSGQVNLSTDSFGNVKMEFVLDAYDYNGTHTMRNVSIPYLFQNKMTPAIAALDDAKKAAEQAEEIRLKSLADAKARQEVAESDTFEKSKYFNDTKTGREDFEFGKKCIAHFAVRRDIVRGLEKESDDLRKRFITHLLLDGAELGLSKDQIEKEVAAAISAYIDNLKKGSEDDFKNVIASDTFLCTGSLDVRDGL
jgi:hypothetical protein